MSHSRRQHTLIMVKRLLTEAKAIRAGGTVLERSLAKFTMPMTAVNFARLVADQGWMSIIETRGSSARTVWHRKCEGERWSRRSQDKAGVRKGWETFKHSNAVTAADKGICHRAP